MKKTKCPECGHTQEIKEKPVDAKTQLFMKFFTEQLKCNFVVYVDCEKCGINFEEKEVENGN
jgi:predicted nucleic-acid-binding Zn-ribbon protein